MTSLKAFCYKKGKKFGFMGIYQVDIWLLSRWRKKERRQKKDRIIEYEGEDSRQLFWCAVVFRDYNLYKIDVKDKLLSTRGLYGTLMSWETIKNMREFEILIVCM